MINKTGDLKKDQDGFHTFWFYGYGSCKQLA